MQTLTVNETKVVDNYPYGFKKTLAKFSLEFNITKGFRSVFQTIDPKNGKPNKPKLGTYNEVMFISTDEKGFVSFNSLSLNGKESINKAVKFLSENFDLYSPEQIKYISKEIVSSLKLDFAGTVTYGGAKQEDIRDYYQPAITKVSEIYKTGANLFGDVELDIKGIDSKKPANFNPFRTTTYTIG